MKKKFLLAVIVFTHSAIFAQNAHLLTTESYSDKKTNVGLDDSLFLNKIQINNTILERYMDLAINKATNNGFFGEDGSGLFFLFSFFGEYRDRDYFYSHILAYSNSFMRHILIDYVLETNQLSRTTTARLFGCMVYKGYLFVFMADNYVKNEDFQNILDITPQYMGINIKDYSTSNFKKNDDSAAFLNTEALLIPYCK